MSVSNLIYETIAVHQSITLKIAHVCVHLCYDPKSIVKDKDLALMMSPKIPHLTTIAIRGPITLVVVIVGTIVLSLAHLTVMA